MRCIAIFLAALLLSSCGTWNRTIDTLDKLSVRYDRIEERWDKAMGTIEEAKAFKTEVMAKIKAIDADQDGRVTLAEMLAGLGGAGGLGAWILGRRNNQSDQRKAVMEARLAALEKTSA